MVRSIVLMPLILGLFLLIGCVEFFPPRPEIGAWDTCPVEIKFEGAHTPLLLPALGDKFYGQFIEATEVFNHKFGHLDATPNLYRNVSEVADSFIFGENLVVAHLTGVLSMYAKGNFAQPMWSVDLTKLKIMPRFVRVSYIPIHGVVVLSTGMDHIYGIDIKTGKILWNKQLRAPLHERIVVQGGNIIFVTVDNYLHVVNAETGQVVWGYQGDVVPVRLSVHHSIAIIGDIIYFASQSGQIMAFDLTIGEVLWRGQLREDRAAKSHPVTLVSRMVPGEQKLLVNVGDGFCHLFDSVTGQKVLQINCVSVREVKIFGDVGLFLTSEGKLSAISTVDGRLLWSFDLTSVYAGSSVLGSIFFDNLLWVVGNNGQFVGLDLSTGQCIREWSAGMPVSELPVIALGKMYLYNASALMVVG